MAKQDPDAPPASAALTRAEVEGLRGGHHRRLTQADERASGGVDAGTVIRSAEMPRTPACDLRFLETGPARRLTEAVKELAVELTLVRGKSRWPE